MSERTYDAAELARLRDIAQRAHAAPVEMGVGFHPGIALSLIAALEKAQGDMAAQMDSHDAWGELWTGKLDVAIAERDSARALLRWLFGRVPRGSEASVRIAKELDQ